MGTIIATVTRKLPIFHSISSDVYSIDLATSEKFARPSDLKTTKASGDDFKLLFIFHSLLQFFFPKIQPTKYPDGR